MSTKNLVNVLNDLLPSPDVETSHQITVRAPVEAVYDAARSVDLSSSTLVRWLFRLRGLPASALSLNGLEQLRFKPLAEERPDHFVLGLVGQFWHPAGRLLDFDPSEFATLRKPGFAKAIWAFHVSAVANGGSELHTVTRVACEDEQARRRFWWYWRVVGPFSRLVRRSALNAIRTKAEAGSAAGSV